MKTCLKYFLFSLLIFASIVGLVYGSLCISSKSYTYEDMVAHYEKHEDTINKIHDYLYKNVDTTDITFIDIRLDDSGNTNKLYFNSKYDEACLSEHIRDWRLNANATNIDTLLQRLSWTQEVLDTLQYKLLSAGCTSLQMRNGLQIGLHHSIMGSYSLLLLDNPTNDDIRYKYNNGCTYIHYKNNIIIEFQEGPIGPKCLNKLQ